MRQALPGSSGGADDATNFSGIIGLWCTFLLTGRRSFEGESNPSLT